jgi:hypothetical protein
MALFDDASLVVTPNGYKAGTLYSIKPTSGAGDMTVVRATTATRVNSAGLIESVAINVPRLDYTDSTCPSLLVEPQRTNLALRSEEFDNATWTTNGLNATVSANVTTSPDGTSSADAILTTITNGLHYIQQRTGSATAGTTYTMSIYVKKLGYDYCRIETSNTATAYAIFRFSTKELTIGGGQVVANSGKVTEMSDGWFRIQMSILPAASATWRWWVECLNDVGSQAFVGDITKGLYVWGFQFEVGSYATSYIPTTSAAVTRNADVISKTGISSLIGQTEGVLFLDLFASAKNNDANTFGTWLIAGAATENFQIYNLGTTLYWYARNTGGTIIDQTANETLVEGTRYKIAYAYKSGDYALYINGVQKRTNANANVPVAVSQFNLSAGTFGASPVIVKNEYNSVVLFPTRLTNAELASLTTI